MKNFIGGLGKGAGIAIGLIIGFIAICCCCSYGLGSSSKKDDVSISKAENTDTSSDSTESSSKNVVNIGDTVKIDGLEVSIESAEEFSYIEDKFYNEKTQTEGNVFLIMYFNVKNTSKESDMLNTMFFNAYADGYKADVSYITLNEPKTGYSNSGTVDAGKSAKMYVAFEVPANWSEFEAVYDDYSNEVSFIISKDSVTKIN